MKRAKSNLRLKDALRVQTAESWLRMGRPLEALQELQRLTQKAWNHPWPEQLVWRAAQAVG
jgi:hypothetical protein